MRAAAVITAVRRRAGLSRRGLASAAGTSPATLAAYESGRVQPGVDTLERIVRAADHALVLDAVPLNAAIADRRARGRELVAVLDLAAQFPARHERTLRCPVFPRS